MPELPDIEAYRLAIENCLTGSVLERVRIRHPFLLRTVDPPIGEIEGRRLVGIERLAKQLVFAFDSDVYAVLHLMIAGRLRYSTQEAKIPGKIGLAAFSFTPGSLLLTEAGTKRRASLALTRGRDGLSAFDPGGIEVLTAGFETFQNALSRENHTLKRGLTDQHLIAGIGNAYSDEILHRARMSPFAMTKSLTDEEIRRLYNACCEVLTEWQDRLAPKQPGAFPKKVTAFHADMKVHGKYGLPCVDCGSPVQRVRYAENESNYCPGCQTGGRVYSDRSLSRLLKGEWPTNLAELANLETRVASRNPDAENR